MPSQNKNFETFENRIEENFNIEDFGNDQGLPLARTIDHMWIQNKLQPDQQPIISNKDFEQNLKEIFERWIRTSDEDYFIVDFPVNEVSGEMKDLINYEEHRDDYYLHGIKFRIVRNGDVHVMEWSKAWDQYFVSEDCITEIKSELAENSYYDACTGMLIDYDESDDSDDW